MTSVPMRSSRRIAATAAALLLFVADAPGREPAQPQQQASRFPFSRAAQQDQDGFYYQPAGLCEDYPEESTTSEKIQRDFAVLRETGAKLLRFGIGWDGIEEAPGEYNWRYWDEIVTTAERDGVTLLPYICYTPQWLGTDPQEFWREPPRDLARFAHFVEQIVTRYRGRIRAWELWNEPDNRDYWRGSAQQFAIMFRGGAQAVRRADPDALVVLGGLAHDADSKFTRALFQQHALGRWIDVINFHSYFETWDNRRAEHLLQRIAGYGKLARSARGKSSPAPELWLAEFGYSSATRADGKVSEWVKARHPFEHTREFQAVALLRHHALALASQQLALTAWFRIWDLPAAEDVIGDDNNRRFGVIDVEGKAKPALQALQLWNQLIDQPVRRGAAKAEGEQRKNAQVFAFEKRDGSVVVAAWLPVSAVAAPATISVRVAAKQDAVLTQFTPIGEAVQNGPIFHDGFIRDVTLEPDSLFIAELKPPLP
ncbi:MAG: cellulase family glycosylhydrolase [Chthoniobacterales bacterium]|nr:cellulase family glycosylhydrolase [Chthoniobacterales bacterium]